MTPLPCLCDCPSSRFSLTSASAAPLLTTPLHFLPFLESRTFNPTSFWPQCSKHPHQLKRMGPGAVLSPFLTLFHILLTTHAQTRSHSSPVSQRRKRAYGVTCPSHRVRHEHSPALPYPALIMEALLLPATHRHLNTSSMLYS